MKVKEKCREDSHGGVCEGRKIKSEKWILGTEEIDETN
jgi:hypothetical protein